ncbi:MAG TPA: DNA replication/repair protein RecF [Pseudomonadaceae bacterium]|nr:DNA replication/repair protein RecF [Pseudomonadaceae bacterium]
MPSLSRLTVTGVRNLAPLSLNPSPSFNLVHGDNGSGKTSLLEAISLLSMGRSFRTHQQKPLIQDGEANAVVHAEMQEGGSLGVRKSRREGTLVKLNGVRAASVSELAQELPIQILHAASFQVLDGSPSDRRAFLDWGVFHVKHRFIAAWRNSRRALSNRNVLLKQNAPAAAIEPWSRELALHAEEVDALRQEYVNTLLAGIQTMAATELLDVLGGAVEIRYWRGWDDATPLAELLQRHLERERKAGHTLYGPHRADLRFLVGGRDCSSTLSRGQAKLLISVLKIAQAEQLQAETSKQSVFLVDDLPSELDRFNQERILSLLAVLRSQVFVTAIDPEVLLAVPALAGSQTKLFHVKHGKISQSDRGSTDPV